MITENLSTLKIHKLTQEQYNRELDAGRIDENALYLTPDEEIDLSAYATKEQLNNKSDKGHNHNDVYYTQVQVDTALQGKANTSHNHDSAYDTKGSAADSLASAKSYTDTKVSGLVSSTVVDNKISSHNTSTSAHSDIRELINGLTTRLNTLANSDDTTLDQMSEIVAYIKNNKSLIDGVTTNKVNVSDIVNNLTTNVTNKPLSAAQGVAIKGLIDALQEGLDGHTHEIADIDGLTTTLANKAEKNHGTHVVYLVADPLMDGTASAGSKNEVARADHRHPTDTSRAAKTDLDSHTGNTTVHITAAERTNWNAAKTHADSAHAPSNAQPNQNAFSNIAVSGQTTVAADTTTDTVTFAGSNISITTDATNDKVTFAVADGSTSAKGVVQLTNSTSSTSTTTAATPNSVKSAYDLANTAKTNAATAQTKADSAYTLAESKVDSLSDLGITATATELNYIDGVTSNVQTQLDNKSASSHTHTNASLGQGTGYCSTSSSTAAKVVSLLNYNLVEGGVVSVEFVYSVPASATMNINSKGAKSIYYRGEAIAENIIKGGDRATFIYYSSRYHLISVDRWHKDIVDLQTNEGKVQQTLTTSNSNYPLLLARNFQSETTTDQTFFDSDVYLNPSTNKIYANISGTATGLEGLTATVSELNYLNGVTSNVQTQLDNKTNKIAGIVHQYAGVNAPDGYLLCDGSFYRTDEYPELFDAIGFTYGESGSGVNIKFAVPNLTARVPVGAGSGYALGSIGGEATHTLTVSEMPKHDHGATYSGNATSANKKYAWYTATGDKIGYQAMETGSGAAHNNMQPYIALNYIISTGK